VTQQGEPLQGQSGKDPKMASFGWPQHDGERRLERRKRPRLMLYWRVYLFRRRTNAAIESRIENLSSEGFYCTLHSPSSLVNICVATYSSPRLLSGALGSPLSFSVRSQSGDWRRYLTASGWAARLTTTLTSHMPHPKEDKRSYPLKRNSGPTGSAEKLYKYLPTS
jgi:hypothetical protein